MAAAHYDALESRDPAARERELFARLPEAIARAMTASGLGQATQGRRSEIHQLARGAGEAAAAAQIRFAVAAERQPAVRRLQRHAARQGQAAAHVARPDLRAGGHRLPTSAGRRARLFAAGFRPGDIVHNSYSYHLTPGAYIMEAGAHALGCAVIPGGIGNTEQQLDAIAHYKPSGYLGTPDFIKILLDTAAKAGKDASSIKRGLVSGAALPALAAARAGRARRRGAAVLRHRRDRRDRLRERGARRHDRQRASSSWRSCGPAPAIRWRTARSARWSSPRSIPTIR